jgi:hypothetical protein
MPIVGGTWQAWVLPRSNVNPVLLQSYILASETVELSAIAVDSFGNLGLLAEYGPGLCVHLPSDIAYSSCSCGRRVLTAQVCYRGENKRQELIA